MDRNSERIVAAGQPVNWLGANFWSRTGGPLMWRNYDPDTVRGELAVLREHGLGMTRSFFYWPDFMPEPDRIDEAMTARFADFLDRHAEAGMSTVPTFIVGHMSGENWDPPWREGRDLYADVWMVARQAWFAGEMVRRFGTHPAVSGWLVSNEMPIYGGANAPREVITAWAQIIRDAVRAAGGTQPFSLGDGAWGTQAGGQHAGILARRHGAAVRFPRPARVPRGRRRGAPALHRGVGVRAGRDVRPPGRARGVRCQLGLRVRRQRRALLPPGAAQQPAGRRDRVDRLVQLRLRRPGRPGSLPASRLRASLRAHRQPRQPQAAASRDEVVRARCSARSTSGTASVQPRTRPWWCPPTWTPATRSPRRTTPATSMTRCARPTCPPGWRTCRSPWPGRATASATTPCSTSCPRSSSCSRPPGPNWNGWPSGARRSTCRTPPGRPDGIAARHMRASTRCSGSSISSGPAWSTRSRTTR